MSIKISQKLTWSFGGPWYWEFQQMDKEIGSLTSQIKFLSHYGFQSTNMGFETLSNLSENEREALFDLMQEHHVTFHPYVYFDYLNTDSLGAKEHSKVWLENLQKYRKFFNCKITTTGLGAGHRFDRVLPLDEKLKRFSHSLSEIADVCSQTEFPLAVENHGDYYCSDLATLCKATPNLFIFLDTGNTFLIGERPVEAFEAAAPYVIGTHFKDHYVKPNHGTLHFEIDGAPLGSGDVQLQACYDILMQKAPNPLQIIMETEMVAPKGMDPVECLKKSIEFINSLK